MDYYELLEELKNFESNTAECKEGFKEDVFGRTMAAFSTRKGGTIFLGVDDQRNPQGIIFTPKMKDRISQVARSCEPSVAISINLLPHDNEKVVCCIKVVKGSGCVYRYKKVPYERREGINHPLSPEEMVELQKRSKKFHFDEMPSGNDIRPGLEGDIDVEKIKKYLDKRGKSFNENFNIRQFLLNNELIDNASGNVKNAAILLFGKNPSKFIPQNKVSLSIFPSIEITNEFIKMDFEGDLEDLFRKIYIEVEKTIKNFSFIRGLERVDVPEYPKEAIREAIINALVHRDYFTDTTEVFIKIFKDRIEITNPGGFPFGGHSWKEIESSGLSIRRNPKIAEFFEKMGLMEQEGHGIKRIKRLAEQHGLRAPEINTTENTFKLIFYGPGEDIFSILESPFKKVLDSGKLNERQKKIIASLQEGESKSLNRNECCERFRYPPRTAARDLKELVQKGFLKQTGAGRGTRYEIV